MEHEGNEADIIAADYEPVDPLPERLAWAKAAWTMRDNPGPDPDGRWFCQPKPSWGDGPWQGEPDRVEWRSADGRPLLAVRNRYGAWCGYAGVEPGHPWHGGPTATLEDAGIDVHGGVTFGNRCGGHICHVPAAGEPVEVWWVGFDCAHFADLMPGMDALMRRIDGSRWSGFEALRREMRCERYWTLDDVRDEAESLARQAEEAAKAPRPAPAESAPETGGGDDDDAS